MSRYVTHFKGKDGNDYLVKDAEGRELKADIIHDTASGAIATFSDGADNLPMEMTVGIEPVQDLHGQDAPYPPGGSVQLMSPVAYTGASYNMNTGVTLTLSEAQTQPTVNKNTITFSVDTAWVGLAFKTGALSAGSYHVHADVTDTSGRKLTFYVVGNNNIIKQKNASTSYNIENRNFTVEADDYIVFFYTLGETGTAKVVNLQVESGEAYTAWHPYSNICPISGWTGCNVRRTGVNLLDESVFDNFANITKDGDHWTGTVSRWISSTGGTGRTGWENIKYLEKTSYCCSARVKLGETGTTNVCMRVTYTDGSKSDSSVKVSAGAEGIIYIITNNAKTVSSFSITYGTGNTGTLDVYWMNINISDPSHDGQYEPYVGNTYPITFPSEAGTVYGGTLTVNKDGTGTLIVDMASVDLGTLTWTYYEAYTSFIGNVTGIASNSALLCSAYQSVNNWWTSSEKPDKSISLATNPYVAVKDSSYTSVSDFKTAMSGVQLVYELATTVTYNLTASQVGQIKSLYGLNNVWGNTGNILELNYAADTKLYISKELDASRKLIELIITANREDSMKATKAYSTGNLMIVNGTLYRATTSIANGATLTVGTNVTATTVAAEIAALS